MKSNFILNQRAYVNPFLVSILLYHSPIAVCVLLGINTNVYKSCYDIIAINIWLFGLLVIHIICVVLSSVAVGITCGSKVHRVVRSERKVIVSMFGLHLLDFAWSVFGYVSVVMEEQESSCTVKPWVELTDISWYTFVFSTCNVLFWFLFGLLCGPRYGTSLESLQLGWKKRCQCIYVCVTCRSYEKHEEQFATLAKMMTNLLIKHNEQGIYETAEYSDIMFSLKLVQQLHGEKKALVEKRLLSNKSLNTKYDAGEAWQGVDDFRRYAPFAIAIYGWPLYVYNHPWKCFRVCGCLQNKSQVVRKDTMLRSHQNCFLNTTQIQPEQLLYLNCRNDVFLSPYAIVQDKDRKEMILSIRGTLSWDDFLVDSFAFPVLLEQQESPIQENCYVHEGVLRTARALITHLQAGRRKSMFWDFLIENADWNLVICGHSLGAGIASTITALLHTTFPNAKGFAFAPPPIFCKALQKWSKKYITAVVHADDLIPRLSLQSLVQLRNEMVEQYCLVADKPLYQVYCCKANRRANFNLNEEGYITQHPSPVLRMMRNHSSQYIQLDANMATPGLPGTILHVESKKIKKRKCIASCCKRKEYNYTKREAGHFDHIFVSRRAYLDHFPHHYDRNVFASSDEIV